MFRCTVILMVVCALLPLNALAQQWRTEPLTRIDQDYMQDQRDVIDALARRHFGRQLNGDKDNDLAVIQRLLDDGIVGRSQVRQLQAMGLILGGLLKSEHGLNWIVYHDKHGRSRSLQVPGFDEDFIFPATQISRKFEVGLDVNVREVYRELEQAIVNIRNKPLL